MLYNKICIHGGRRTNGRGSIVGENKTYISYIFFNYWKFRDVQLSLDIQEELVLEALKNAQIQ